MFFSDNWAHARDVWLCFQLISSLPTFKISIYYYNLISWQYLLLFVSFKIISLLFFLPVSKDALNNFAEKINWSLSSQELLINALTHKSFLSPDSTQDHLGSSFSHNERLVFLGIVQFEIIVFTRKQFNPFPSRDSFLMSKIVWHNQCRLSKITKGGGGLGRSGRERVNLFPPIAGPKPVLYI